MKLSKTQIKTLRLAHARLTAPLPQGQIILVPDDAKAATCTYLEKRGLLTYVGPVAVSHRASKVSSYMLTPSGSRWLNGHA